MTSRRWLIPLAAVGAALVYRGLRYSAARTMADPTWDFSGPRATLYDRLFSAAIQGFYARVARRVAAAAPSGHVLDVGCGPGRLAVRLARQAPAITVIGIDVSPDMIQLARRRAEAEHLSGRVRFQLADVGALPFPDDQFDAVVTTLSLHHWPDPTRGLAAVRRVLKPDGKAYIYDLADWIFQLTHHGIPLPTVLAEGPFASIVAEPGWSLGAVPFVRGFSLGR